MALNMSVLTLCKFTPLGFETLCEPVTERKREQCKFTPLGFETACKASQRVLKS